MTNSHTTRDHVTTRGRHRLPTALLLQMTAMVGWAADDVSFHLTCDGTVNADRAAGVAVPTVTGQVRYHPGVYGQALEVGETGATLTFPSQGNLPLSKGTVEMWLLPVKWSMGERGAYDSHHLFFRAQDPNGWFQIYKFDSNVMWCVRGKDSDYGALQGLISYDAVLGRWMHVVTTWDGESTVQYVNGQSFSKILKPMPGLPATFELGDIEWKGTTPGGRKPQTTLLDEVSIYRRPLSAGEVQTCFAAGISQLVARSRPLLSIPVIAAAPTIDGKAPVAEWAKASRLRGFRLVQDKLQGDDAIGLDQGLSLLSSHDDARLYLAFQRQMEAGVTLVSAPRERDADLSQDDSVVVELAAVWNGIDKPTESYRFEVNLSGSRADAKVDKAGKADPSWNPEWQAAASAENLDRVMEFAIPYAAMGRPAPVAGERWGIRLLSRTAIAGGGKSVAFWGGSPATGEWGELVFRADGTQVLVKSIHTNRKGEVDLDATVIAGDLAVKSSGVMAEVAGSTVQGLSLSGDGFAGKPLSGRIGDQAAQRLETLLLDRSTGEHLWYDRFAIDLEKGAILDVTLRPSLGVGQLTVSIQGAGVDPTTNPVQIELLNATTAKVAFSTSLGVFTDSLANVTLPIKDLLPGDYLVRSTVRLPGSAQPSIKEVRFSKPAMPWIGNTVGVLDDQHVPEPWTPMTVTQQDGTTTVQCWGRSFVFTGSPLPVQIRSQGTDLLAAPASLTGSTNGSTVAWTGTGFQIVTATPAKVSFQGTASLGKATFAVKGSIEYDGLLWLEVDGALVGSDFDQLSLVLPLQKDASTYRMVGESVQRNTAAWKSGLVNSVYLGSENVGMSWLAESDKDWKTIPTASRLEVSSTKAANIFQVNLISGGTADAKGVFAFGLQPTPSRPMPENWRRQAINHVNAWVAPWEMRYHGYPMLPPGDAGVKAQEKLRRMATIWRSGGGRAIPYLHSSMLSSASPEWSFFSSEWKNPGNIYPYVPKEEATHSGLYGVCPASEGWTDFDVFSIRDYLIRTDLDGVYHDFGSPAVCANTLHGCNGGIPLLAYRNLHKRIYTMLRELGRERGRSTWYMHHTSICSGLVIPAMVSFADSIADSEQLGGQIPRLGPDMFIRQVPLEYYRIRGSAKPFGVANNFIINRGPVLPANYAMCLVHDIVSQFGGEGWQIWQALRQPLLQFGLGDDDIQFRGYWEGRGGATVTGSGLAVSDVLMSLYVKPGVRTLAIMVNRDTKARTEKISFDWKSLGLPEGTPVTDMLTGESVAAEKDGYSVKLEALGARYLVAGAMLPSVTMTAPGQPVVRWAYCANGTIEAISGQDAQPFAAQVRGVTQIVEGRLPGTKALRLDGKSCQVQTGEAPVYNSKELTIAAWIKPTTLAGKRGLISLLDGEGQDLDNRKSKARLLVGIHDGRISFSFLAVNGTWKSGETAPILIENTWQHVAVTFKADGKSIGLWLGGKLVQEFTNEVPAVPMSNYWTRDVLFGKTSYDTAIDDGFQGDLGEVTLFADVLDPDQMTKIAK